MQAPAGHLGDPQVTCAVQRREGAWEDLAKRRYRRVMVLAAGLPLLQQLSGINTVVLFSSQVSPKAGTASPWPKCSPWSRDYNQLSYMASPALRIHLTATLQRSCSLQVPVLSWHAQHLHLK